MLFTFVIQGGHVVYICYTGWSYVVYVYYTGWSACKQGLETLMFITDKIYCADPGGRAFWSIGLQQLDWWDCGCESRWGHERLSLVNVVCCQVQASVTGPILPSACVWSGETLTVYTYTEYVDRGQNDNKISCCGNWWMFFSAILDLLHP